MQIGHVLNLTNLLYCSVIGEVAAENSALNLGHLGRRELVVQPATSQVREVALMRRILLVLAVAAVMALMVVASASLALADPGGQRGHQGTLPDGSTTQSGGDGQKGGGGGGRETNNFSGDCDSGCTFESTESGKTGNDENKPGRISRTTTVDNSAEGDEIFISDSYTTEGSTGGGGGRKTSDVAVKKNFEFVRDVVTCKGSDNGSGAPNCG